MASQKFQKIDLDKFAELFDELPDSFSSNLCQEIKKYNFEYEIPSKNEYNEALLTVLKRIESDHQVIGSQNRENEWFTGWKENLDEFIASHHDEEKLKPKFIRRNTIVRLNQQFIKPKDSSNFEYNFVKIFRHHILNNYFKDVDNIYEFGCGTGFNLLAASKLFPEKNLFGSDFVQSSVDLVNELAKSKKIKLSGELFNMLKPRYDYKIRPNSGVMTFGSLEQLASDINPIIEYFLATKPSICHHTEPAVELYDSNNLTDYLGSLFQNKRGYTSGLIVKLRELEDQKRIKIIKIRRLYFGSLFMEGYNQIIWKPL